MSKQGGFMSKLFKRKNSAKGSPKEAGSDVVLTPSAFHGNANRNQATVTNNNEIKKEKEVKVTILRSHSSEAGKQEKTVQESRTKRVSNTSGHGSSSSPHDSSQAEKTVSSHVTKMVSKPAVQVRQQGHTEKTQEQNKEQTKDANQTPTAVSPPVAPVPPSNGQGKTMEPFPRTAYSYPEKMSQFIHRTHCYIPAPLAAVLDASPELVAPMVQAFYYRDPVDLKACVTFTHFRPGTRVVRQVKMTKCLYAQLIQQQFIPDRRSGYTLPSRDEPTYKSHDLGIKLAHGAEILCSKCGSGASRDDDMSCDTKWLTFLESLKHKGYFKGEIQGSQLYNKLLDDAKRFFQTSASLQAGDESSPGYKILQILKTAQYDVEEMRKQEKNLDPPDDDSWLSLSPDQLDNMLNEAYQDVFQNNTTTDLTKVAHNMKAFVNKICSHEGAEFPGGEDEDEVTFDPDGFIQTMHKMFDFKDEKLTSSDDDMSEYGSEDDLDFDMGSRSKPGGGGKGNFMDLEEMKSYMEQMDRELASTEMGKSFVTEETQKKPVAPPRNKKKQKQQKNASSSTTAQSSAQNGPKPAPRRSKTAPNESQTAAKSAPNESKTAPKATLSDDFSDIDDLDEDFQPVNVDLNLVKNLLESHSSQQGLAGPTSNILGSMGIRLPADSGEQD